MYHSYGHTMLFHAPLTRCNVSKPSTAATHFRWTRTHKNVLAWAPCLSPRYAHPCIASLARTYRSWQILANRSGQSVRHGPAMATKRDVALVFEQLHGHLATRAEPIEFRAHLRGTAMCVATGYLDGDILMSMSEMGNHDDAYEF